MFSLSLFVSLQAGEQKKTVAEQVLQGRVAAAQWQEFSEVQTLVTAGGGGGGETGRRGGGGTPRRGQTSDSTVTKRQVNSLRRLLFERNSQDAKQ